MKIAMFKGKIVLDKLDLNVPTDKSTGDITDTQKIEEAVKSIAWCLDNGAHAVLVLSHQGRKKEESLRKHADVLKRYFSNVLFTKRDGNEVVEAVAGAPSGSVIVLENMRSDDEEKDYDDVQLTKLYQTVKSIEDHTKKQVVFVKDDFAVCHRKDLSIYGLPMQLRNEGYAIMAGPIMRNEIENTKTVGGKIKNDNVICIWGGKKFEDYMHLFQKFLETYPNSIVLTSGPLSILMQKAMGRDVGGNADFFGITEDLIVRATPIVKKFKGRVLTPVDYYATNADGKHVTESRAINGIIVDIGPKTIELYTNIIKENPESVIIGNGPLGQYEVEENRKGTKEVYSEVFRKENNNFVIGGGGDFNAVMNILQLKPHVSSTGGKAFIECIVNGNMPGLEPCGIVEVLSDR